MPAQESPSIKPLHVRVTQELWRALELLAARRGYGDVSSLVRAILIDSVREIALTSEDYRLIAERVAAREETLRHG